MKKARCREEVAAGSIIEDGAGEGAAASSVGNRLWEE